MVNDAVILITGIPHPGVSIPLVGSPCDVLLSVFSLDDETAADGRAEFSGVNSLHAAIISCRELKREIIRIREIFAISTDITSCNRGTYRIS